jgi:hypothetical protein
MLVDATMYERARKEVKRLEDLVKAGTATERDRERLQAGGEECLCWEWEHEGAPLSETLEDLRVETLPKRDPRAIQFVDWWERNEYQIDTENIYWGEAFVWWFLPTEEAMTVREYSALWDDASAEIHERRWLRMHEPEGMVVSDFENIPDNAEEAA